MSRPAFVPTFVFAAALLVQLVSGIVVAKADPASDARAFIDTLAQKAIANVTTKDISDQERAERFRTMFVASFDIDAIGRSMLSRYAWQKATPDQQKDFIKQFEDITVLTWSRRFKEYSGQTLQTTQATPGADNIWTVESEFVQPQGQPIPVQWKVRQANDGWRIVDIVVESSSMILTQRQDYASALQSSGGDIAGLLNTMRQKVAQLQSGS